jgi:hypothetical protein
MAAPFDIWDQAALTDLSVRPVSTQFEDQPRLGDLLAPTMSIQSRVAKIRTRQILAFGVGQFKAPDASPGLYTPNQTWSENIVELAQLEEVSTVNGEDWIRLNSSDETTRRAAGVELVDRGKILALRNERLTEKMRWDAMLNGNLTITYPSGQQLYIDYGLLPTHKVTLTAGALWSATSTADPIANIRTWAETIAADSGYYGVHLHMSSKTYSYMVANAVLKGYLTATGRSMLLPTYEDVIALLRDGTDITIYDNGYRAESVGSGRGLPSSLTRFLPDGVVLMTTDYQIEGTPIAQTLDGQVLVSSGYNSIDIRQGMQSEVIVDHLRKTHLMRVASARIPRIVYPECFLVATVV